MLGVEYTLFLNRVNIRKRARVRVRAIFRTTQLTERGEKAEREGGLPCGSLLPDLPPSLLPSLSPSRPPSLSLSSKTPLIQQVAQLVRDDTADPQL